MARNIGTGDASLWRLPVASGEASVLFESTGYPIPGPPVARGASVYFTADHDDSGFGVLYSVSGSMAAPIPGVPRVGPIAAVDASHVYAWDPSSDQSLVRVPLSGGNEEPYLQLPSAFQVQLSETHVYWTVESWPDSAEIWSLPK
jgi:hypothetical protein